MDKKMVCPCGLTCCDCLFYKSEIYETAYKLKELIIKNELDKFLPRCSSKGSIDAMAEHLDLSGNQMREGIGKQLEVFRQMPEFMKVLDGIIDLQCKTTCQEAGGCSIGGNKHECKALKCIKTKGYEGCWQCTEYENCDSLKFLKNGYGYVIEDNLRTVKEKGVEAVRPRGSQYYAWQRK